jgi:hypothetical protein
MECSLHREKGEPQGGGNVVRNRLRKPAASVGPLRGVSDGLREFSARVSRCPEALTECQKLLSAKYLAQWARVNGRKLEGRGERGGGMEEKCNARNMQKR